MEKINRRRMSGRVWEAKGRRRKRELMETVG